MAAADGRKTTRDGQLTGQNVLVPEVSAQSADASTPELSPTSCWPEVDEFSATGSFTPQLQLGFQHWQRCQPGWIH